MAAIDNNSWCIPWRGLLCLGLLLGGENGSGNELMNSETRVTDAFVITENVDQFNHDTVTLSGRFAIDTPHVATDVQCEPVPEEEIVILDTYRPYPTPWGIVDGDVFVGVEVRGSEGTIIGTRPAFEEGQEIQLTGEIVPTVVVPECSRRGFRSFFLFVNKDALPFTPK